MGILSRSMSPRLLSYASGFVSRSEICICSLRRVSSSQQLIIRFTLRRLVSNTASSTTRSPHHVEEYRVRDNHLPAYKRSVTVYSPSENEASMGWSVVQREQTNEHGSNDGSRSTGPADSKAVFDTVRDNVITHFLPARYPDSVTTGYARFAGFGFFASIAGSAGMVLSTQTLLLAVGVVGSAQQASVMAGALNWVLKDGIGQLGGVWFASLMSRAGSAKFDADPKTWRMVAALSLDGATLLEILSPLVAPWMVLPIASVANIGKNIGFLTASASRAALHQSMAISGNLADLTAKAGSQSLAASLVGTVVGIGLSPILGDVSNYALGFVFLGAVHQGCNYVSLKSAPLFHLNRHRLHLLLDHFVTTNNHVLAPHEVAKREFILPLMNKDQAHTWLSIGTSLGVMCPGGPDDFQKVLSSCSGEQYAINVVQDRTHLIFFSNAMGEDLIRGMLHAYYVHYVSNGEPSADGADVVSATHMFVRENCDELLGKMAGLGWKVGTEFTSIEPSNAVRLQVEETVQVST